jgi:hypothetical protein
LHYNKHKGKKEMGEEDKKRRLINKILKGRRKLKRNKNNRRVLEEF